MEDNSKYDKLINNIKEFVVSVDKDNKLVLADKNLFHSKFSDYSAYEELFSKLTQLRELVTNNLLSENYLNEEWGGIQNFVKFIDENHEEIVVIIDSIWINEINLYVSSERPVKEKIDHLLNEISGLAGVQFFGGNEFVKRKKYLKTKIDELELKHKYLSVQQDTITETEIILDYSDNSQAEQIVFLHELKILDFLQEKMKVEHYGFSTNKMAEIVSTFTGIKQSYVQSMLNPIFSKRVDQKNNPLTENNLKNVREKLMKIGFNNIKTT